MKRQKGEPCYGRELDKYSFVVYTIPDRLADGVYHCVLSYSGEFVLEREIDEEDLSWAIENPKYLFGMLGWQYGIGHLFTLSSE